MSDKEKFSYSEKIIRTTSLEELISNESATNIGRAIHAAVSGDPTAEVQNTVFFIKPNGEEEEYTFGFHYNTFGATSDSECLSGGIEDYEVLYPPGRYAEMLYENKKDLGPIHKLQIILARDSESSDQWQAVHIATKRLGEFVPVQINGPNYDLKEKLPHILSRIQDLANFAKEIRPDPEEEHQKILE